MTEQALLEFLVRGASCFACWFMGWRTDGLTFFQRTHAGARPQSEFQQASRNFSKRQATWCGGGRACIGGGGTANAPVPEFHLLGAACCRFRGEPQYAWVDMARAAADGESGVRAVAEDVAAAFAEAAHRPTPPPAKSGETCGSGSVVLPPCAAVLPPCAALLRSEPSAALPADPVLLTILRKEEARQLKVYQPRLSETYLGNREVMGRVLRWLQQEWLVEQQSSLQKGS